MDKISNNKEMNPRIIQVNVVTYDALYKPDILAQCYKVDLESKYLHTIGHQLRN